VSLKTKILSIHKMSGVVVFKLMKLIVGTAIVSVSLIIPEYWINCIRYFMNENSRYFAIAEVRFWIFLLSFSGQVFHNYYFVHTQKQTLNHCI